MSRILISSYAALTETVRRHRPSHLLTLMIEPHVETPPGIAPERHLRMLVHDIAGPVEGNVTPCADHIAEILAFSRGWDRSAPFLVHCWAGISRSTAAAYILMCDIHGPGHEHAIAQALRFRAPHAQPNRLMIRLADDVLERKGRMIAAVENMGEARSLDGAVVELPLGLDDL